MPPSMEGALWKWTNYMNGWQLRWFVLDVGVLSYYKSQDDIKLGSRGSVKMGCCEVSAQFHDALRIDLKIPPDQYIYIKATTSAERQQWLVALGTSKACLTQGNTPKKAKKKNDVEIQPKETLSEKMSAVHICKDVLIEQINSIKKLCKTKEELHEFQEAATLLSATCDTFLHDLTDCIRMAQQQVSSSVSLSPMASPRKSQIKDLSLPKSHTKRTSHSNDHTNNSSPPHSSLSPTSSTSSHTSQKSPIHEVHLPLTPPSELQAATKEGVNQTQPEKQKRKAPTLFSTSPNRFTHVRVMNDGGIPTKIFLLACNSILPIFDVLGPTAFAPVKLDISGNIKKLRARYESDVESCSTLQSMLNVEIQSNTCTAKNSATDALLWLKRALQFTNAFLEEINKGERELVVVASTAYSKTLRKYHGWIVRGVFAMAVKAVPYWKDFVKALGTTDSGIASESDVLTAIREFSHTLGDLIDRINQFYSVHKLDSYDTV